MSDAHLREYSRRHGYGGEILGLPSLRRRGSIDDTTRFGDYTGGLSGPAGFNGNARRDRDVYGGRGAFGERERLGGRNGAGGRSAYDWRDDDDDGLRDIARSIERDDHSG